MFRCHFPPEAYLPMCCRERWGVLRGECVTHPFFRDYIPPSFSCFGVVSMLSHSYFSFVFLVGESDTSDFVPPGTGGLSGYHWFVLYIMFLNYCRSNLRPRSKWVWTFFEEYNAKEKGTYCSLGGLSIGGCASLSFKMSNYQGNTYQNDKLRLHLYCASFCYLFEGVLMLWLILSEDQTESQAFWTWGSKKVPFLREKRPP